MHLSAGDIKLYIDSAIPNRLLLRYLTHFFDVTCIQKRWALHNFWLVLVMWKHIKMSGLVRKLLSHMQKGRFEDFCQRCRNSLDTWRSFLYIPFEFSMVTNCSERWAVIAAITGARATEVSSLVASVTCPARAAAALPGTGKESRRLW